MFAENLVTGGKSTTTAAPVHSRQKQLLPKKKQNDKYLILINMKAQLSA